MTKQIEWEGISLVLLAEKVLYIPAYHTVVLSDWHLGKLGHFRQEGFFVPPMQLQEEFDRLTRILQRLQVQQVVFLGDLFHSTWNREWDEFLMYLQQFKEMAFILTKGNHDILSEAVLHQAPLQVVDYLALGDRIILSHEPWPDLPAHILNIVGHLHPGIQIQGRGRQVFRLPCFVLQDNVFILPAFGRWTGLQIQKDRGASRLFAIVGNGVIAMF
ncbi:ligase-associated DNA damage response endonuclease PdeM [Sphingobacterium luzhongxinii]|uniref:ligase-associated DNA damage response endonuclease PdeM n=1 Tax=Sphingobacterium luzhongxinii TaxID=2654181 RepID=UPI0013D97BAC|nr:ligase-associated DNA damage response endonuclease PdeM [Sphingobacterium sp. xlx-73]